jgi:hypothetical protein
MVMASGRRSATCNAAGTFVLPPGRTVGSEQGNAPLAEGRLLASASAPNRRAFVETRAIRRLIALAVALAIVGLTVESWMGSWPLVVAAWGADYDFFVSVASRWLHTGEFYAAHQLAGPYEAAINVDTLYPPFALFLFLPFVWAPAFLWWAIPLAIIVWSVARWRPVYWVVPFLALMVWWPRTQSIIVWGNTGMWIAAFVALGLRVHGAAAALILVKPSLGPFALIGLRSRAWWAIALVMALVSLPMLRDYLTAITNNIGDFPGLDYSVQDIPFIAIPVIAWMARTDVHERSQGE